MKHLIIFLLIAFSSCHQKVKPEAAYRFGVETYYQMPNNTVDTLSDSARWKPITGYAGHFEFHIPENYQSREFTYEFISKYGVSDRIALYIAKSNQNEAILYVGEDSISTFGLIDVISLNSFITRETSCKSDKYFSDSTNWKELKTKVRDYANILKQ